MICSPEFKIVNCLRQCTCKQLKQIHSFIITTSLDQFSLIRLKFLQRSTEYGEMGYADLIFTQIGGLSNTEITIWNAMIRGYAYNGPVENSLLLFDEMTLKGLTPNNFTYPYVMNACSHLGLLGLGKKVHCRIIKCGFEHSYSVGNGIFDFYVKMSESLPIGAIRSRVLNDARKIFDSMCEKTLELWNKMISQYVSTGDVHNARKLFDEMAERDVISCNTMLSGYAKTGMVSHARDLFELMQNKDVISWTTMLRAYASTGDIESARNIFEKIPNKNVVSWNCMMSSYKQKGKFQHILDLFIRMQSEGVAPDSFTFVSALSACSNLTNLETGKWIHYLIRDWHRMNVIVGTTLIEMYATCGDIDKGFTIFIKTGSKDVFCYNIMIKSLAIHGRAEDAIKIFHLMVKKKLKPNDFTFSSALSACSHRGLVEEGLEIFKTMKSHFNIAPKHEHYCSVIDMLCKNDRLEEAESLIDGMEIEPDIAIWGALLGGCKERGNVELGEKIVNKAIVMRGNESGVHALLSNIYASLYRWPEAVEARRLMEEKGIWKQTGNSSIIR